VRLAALLVVVLQALTGCAFGAPNNPDVGQAPNLTPPSYTPGPDQGPPSVIASVLVTDLDAPWGIAFLPDGTALVTERTTRRILEVAQRPGQAGMSVIPIQTIDAAVADGDGGLLGIAVSPQFLTDQTIYIYYSSATDNRIAKLVLGSAPQPILTGIAKSTTGNGGQLHFGPDGFLYASTGDAGVGASAQNLSSLNGKILRLNTDGTPAPGNPFPGSVIWAYGFHNVEGFGWDPQGRMYATEFGENTWDEVNQINPGGNYGFPAVEGIVHQFGLIDPIEAWPTTAAGCSGAVFTETILIAACLAGERLWLMRFGTDGKMVGDPTAALVGSFGRLRGAALAPDGSVWVSTSNRDGHGTPRPGDDRILRIITSGGGAISRA
jgi:glucose/arabinose dehydrogenase